VLAGGLGSLITPKSGFPVEDSWRQLPCIPWSTCDSSRQQLGRRLVPVGCVSLLGLLAGSWRGFGEEKVRVHPPPPRLGTNTGVVFLLG